MKVNLDVLGIFREARGLIQAIARGRVAYLGKGHKNYAFHPKIVHTWKFARLNCRCVLFLFAEAVRLILTPD